MKEWLLEAKSALVALEEILHNDDNIDKPEKNDYQTLRKVSENPPNERNSGSSRSASRMKPKQRNIAKVPAQLTSSSNLWDNASIDTTIKRFKSYLKEQVYSSSSLLDVFRQYDAGAKTLWNWKDIAAIVQAYDSDLDNEEAANSLAKQIHYHMIIDSAHDGDIAEVTFNDLYIFVYDESFVNEVQRPFQYYLASQYSNRGIEYKSNILNLVKKYTTKRRGIHYRRLDARDTSLQSDWLDSTKFEQLLNEIVMLDHNGRTIWYHSFDSNMDGKPSSKLNDTEDDHRAMIRRLRRRFDVDGDGWCSVSLLLKVIHSSSYWRRIDKRLLQEDLNSDDLTMLAELTIPTPKHTALEQIPSESLSSKRVSPMNCYQMLRQESIKRKEKATTDILDEIKILTSRLSSESTVIEEVEKPVDQQHEGPVNSEEIMDEILSITRKLTDENLLLKESDSKVDETPIRSSGSVQSLHGSESVDTAHQGNAMRGQSQTTDEDTLCLSSRASPEMKTNNLSNPKVISLQDQEYEAQAKDSMSRGSSTSENENDPLQFIPAPLLNEIRRKSIQISATFMNDWMTMNSTPAANWYDESIRGLGRELGSALRNYGKDAADSSSASSAEGSPNKSNTTSSQQQPAVHMKPYPSRKELSRSSSKNSLVSRQSLSDVPELEEVTGTELSPSKHHSPHSNSQTVSRHHSMKHLRQISSRNMLIPMVKEESEGENDAAYEPPAPKISIDDKGISINISSSYINEWFMMMSTPAAIQFDESVRGLGRGLGLELMEHGRYIYNDKNASSRSINSPQSSKSTARSPVPQESDQPDRPAPHIGLVAKHRSHNMSNSHYHPDFHRLNSNSSSNGADESSRGLNRTLGSTLTSHLEEDEAMQILSPQESPIRFEATLQRKQLLKDSIIVPESRQTEADNDPMDLAEDREALFSPCNTQSKNIFFVSPDERESTSSSNNQQRVVDEPLLHELNIDKAEDEPLPLNKITNAFEVKEMTTSQAEIEEVDRFIDKKPLELSSVNHMQPADQASENEAEPPQVTSTGLTISLDVPEGPLESVVDHSDIKDPSQPFLEANPLSTKHADFRKKSDFMDGLAAMMNMVPMPKLDDEPSPVISSRDSAKIRAFSDRQIRTDDTGSSSATASSHSSPAPTGRKPPIIPASNSTMSSPSRPMESIKPDITKLDIKSIMRGSVKGILQSIESFHSPLGNLDGGDDIIPDWLVSDVSTPEKSVASLVEIV
jgi:hypothetical protein